jgi:hypothetical protein
MSLLRLVKNHRLLGLVFFLALTFGSRAPFQSQLLYHWDSCLYAFALVEMDVSLQQPHPPGNAGYVLLGRLFLLFAGEAHLALLLLSLTASLAATGLFWWWLTERFALGLAAFLTAAFVLSPLFWFAGEVSLPYAVNLPFSIAFLWMGTRTWRSAGEPWLAALFFFLSGAVRVQVWVLLFPALLYVLFTRCSPRRGGLLLGCVGAAIVAYWAVVIPLTGGLDEWRVAGGSISGFIRANAPLLQGGEGLGMALGKLLVVGGWSLNLLLGVVVLSGFWPRGSDVGRRLAGLALAPVVLYALLVHFNKPLYLLEALPAALFICGVVVERLLAAPAVSFRAAVVVLGLGVLCLEAAVFLMSDGAVLSRHEIMHRNDDLLEAFTTVRQALPVSGTILGQGTFFISWHHFRCYLPEYELIALQPIPTARGQVYRRVRAGRVENSFTPLPERALERAVLLWSPQAWNTLTERLTVGGLEPGGPGPSLLYEVTPREAASREGR